MLWRVHAISTEEVALGMPIRSELMKLLAKLKRFRACDEKHMQSLVRVPMTPIYN